MSKNITAALCLTVACLSGCGALYKDPSRPVKMEKGSAVDLRTQLDAAELVWNSMQRLGCRQTDVICPEIIEKKSRLQSWHRLHNKRKS